MKRRRSLNHREQITTLKAFLREKRWTQVAFVAWLESKGILITGQYLNDVLNERRNPGPRFKEIFRHVTGIELVDGLIEKDRSEQ